MPFEIVRNNILNMNVDAIVNITAADSITESTIHRRTNIQMLDTTNKPGIIAPGNAEITPSFRQSPLYVIHTTAPTWINGRHNETKILVSCYRNSLVLAKKYQCESIAFPLISTDNNGFPQAKALKIAIKEFSTFLMENDLHIYLVISDKQNVSLPQKLIKSVTSYIDKNYIHEEKDKRHSKGNPLNRLKELQEEIEFTMNSLTKAAKVSDSKTIGGLPTIKSGSYPLEADTIYEDFTDIDTILDNLDAGFSETLLNLIDQTGKKDSEIYKKANIDRKLFSKIRNNPRYQPSKTTAIAFAFALELDIDETKNFISRAGFALSHSSKFDVIVEYFLIHQYYDIFELNEVLFHFDQPLIGA